MEIILTKEQKREYKKWLKKDYLLKGERLTKFCNTNNDKLVKSGGLDKDIFINFKDDQVNGIIKNIEQYSVFPKKAIPSLKIFLIKAQESLNIEDPKTKELSYLKEYWDFVETLKETKYPWWNTWVKQISEIFFRGEKK